MRFLFSLAALILLGAIAGCSNRPARVVPPSIDAVAAGQAAIAEYDANGNGLIDGRELDRVASVKSALDRIDKNGDKQVSAEEITARINEWLESRLGLIGCSVRVTLDGRPLEGATVTFVPEKFLGEDVKRAEGKTTPQGTTMMIVDDPELKARRIGGVQCGFYRVQITTQSGSPIPVKYNIETILGEEVALGAPCTATVVTYNLKRK